MTTFIIVLCLVVMVGFAISAAMLRSMLKSAVSLAAMSAALAVILYMMGAIWAALFELSVCVGLITVVFISAISLTTPDRRDEAHAADHRRRFAALPFILIALGAAIIAVLVYTGFSLPLPGEEAVAEATFNQVFWQTRQADILGQILMLLAGAFAVVVLFKEGKKI
ncbi:MAG: hypothetical protein K6B40_02280 [Firmicutes bacterium]|nr:hypothetical protein [Bacillota bacterium]